MALSRVSIASIGSASANHASAANTISLEGWSVNANPDVTEKVIADAEGWNSDARIDSDVRNRLMRDRKTEDVSENAPAVTRPKAHPMNVAADARTNEPRLAPERYEHGHDRQAIREFLDRSWINWVEFITRQHVQRLDTTNHA
jgi:hypothetical protein